MRSEIIDLPRGWSGTDITVGHINRLIHESLQQPIVVQTARHIVRNLPERDKDAEIRAISKFVRSHIRYTNEAIETLSAPWLMLDEIRRYGKAVGDCDDHIILWGALLRSLGHPVRFKVVSQFRDKHANHIYGQVRSPRRGWVTDDLIVKNREMGWEIPGQKITASKTYDMSGGVGMLSALGTKPILPGVTPESTVNIMAGRVTLQPGTSLYQQYVKRRMEEMTSKGMVPQMPQGPITVDVKELMRLGLSISNGKPKNTIQNRVAERLRRQQEKWRNRQMPPHIFPSIKQEKEERKALQRQRQQERREAKEQQKEAKQALRAAYKSGMINRQQWQTERKGLRSTFQKAAIIKRRPGREEELEREANEAKRKMLDAELRALQLEYDRLSQWLPPGLQKQAAATIQKKEERIVEEIKRVPPTPPPAPPAYQLPAWAQDTYVDPYSGYSEPAPMQEEWQDYYSDMVPRSSDEKDLSPYGHAYGTVNMPAATGPEDYWDLDAMDTGDFMLGGGIPVNTGLGIIPIIVGAVAAVAQTSYSIYKQRQELKATKKLISAQKVALTAKPTAGAAGPTGETGPDPFASGAIPPQPVPEKTFPWTTVAVVGGSGLVLLGGLYLLTRKKKR